MFPFLQYLSLSLFSREKISSQLDEKDEKSEPGKSLKEKKGENQGQITFRNKHKIRQNYYGSKFGKSSKSVSQALIAP